MSLEDIIKGIYEKANIEIENIRKRAEEESKNIIEKANIESKKITEDARKNIEKELMEEKMRRISVKNVEMRRKYMDEISLILDLTFQRIKNELKTYRNSDEYRIFIKRSLDDAIREIGRPEKDLVVRISPGEKDLVQGNFQTIEDPSLKELGGIIVESRDGSIRSNRSLEEILNEKSGEIKSSIYEKIKGEI